MTLWGNLSDSEDVLYLFLTVSLSDRLPQSLTNRCTDYWPRPRDAKCGWNQLPRSQARTSEASLPCMWQNNTLGFLVPCRWLLYSCFGLVCTIIHHRLTTCACAYVTDYRGKIAWSCHAPPLFRYISRSWLSLLVILLWPLGYHI